MAVRGRKHIAPVDQRPAALEFPPARHPELFARPNNFNLGFCVSGQQSHSHWTADGHPAMESCGIRSHFISYQYPRRTRKGNSPRAAVSPPMTLKMLRLSPHVPSANEGSQSPSSDADAAAAVVVTDVVEVVVVVVVVLADEDCLQSHLGLQ